MPTPADPWITDAVSARIGYAWTMKSRRTLVPFGANWRYRHQDGPPPVGWTGETFDDGDWSAGHAPLGYSRNESGTRIDPGSSFKWRPLSAQLRHAFVVNQAEEYARSPLTLAVHRTMGVRVFLNGLLVAWDGVPWPNFADDVSTHSFTASDTTRFPLQFAIGGRSLRSGTNVVAVDLRHAQREYGAMAFDLALATGDEPLDRTQFAASVTPKIPSPIVPGSPAPDFEWLDVRTKQPRRLREFFGKPFLLQFSGAECRPCWKKLPIIRRWADAGLACLTISSWGTVEDMGPPAERHGDLLRGIVVGAEPKAYDSYQTACYRAYGLFNGSILVGAAGNVLRVATGFTLDEFLSEVGLIDRDLHALGYRFEDVPADISVLGGSEDWRVVTSTREAIGSDTSQHAHRIGLVHQ